MTGPKASLDRLDAALRAQRPEYHAGLRPGATAADLAAVEAAVGAPLPEALVAFLRWRGGGRGRLVTNWSTMDASEIAAAKRTLDELLEDGEFDEPSHWHHGWVPFLANGGGDHLCVDLAGCFGGTPGQVLELWHDETWRTVLAPSLEAWLEILAAAYEAGGVTEDPQNGFAELDEATLSALRKKHAPGHPKEHEASEAPSAPSTKRPSAKVPANKKPKKPAQKKVLAKRAKKPAGKPAKKRAKKPAGKPAKKAPAKKAAKRR